MIKHNQDGAINTLLLPLIITGVFLVGTLSFGLWAFSSRQDYKNNVDQKIQLAQTAATAAESSRKDKEFAEISKSPLKTYNGPEEYGSIVLQYPKTWSAYNGTAGNGGLSLYFNPDVVPSTTDRSANYALRINVLDQSYSETLAAYDTSDGEISVAPYALPKLPKIIGAKVTGLLESGKQGTTVLLPLRDKTVQITTESNNFLGDYNNSILPNLTFSP